MTQFNLLQVVGDRVVSGLKCSACDLSAGKNLQTVCMDGVGPSGVDFMFVGRAPADEDDIQGSPYTGKGGRIFRELLLDAGINSEKVYITNCLKCCPFEEDTKDAHWKACRGYLIQEIKRIKPKCLVAVGSQATSWLTGFTGIKVLRKHGLECTLDKSILVYPLEQPAAIFHQQGRGKEKLKKEIVEDLLWLKGKAAQGKLNEADSTPIDYRLCRTPEDVECLFAELASKPLLSCDLETTSLFPTENDQIKAIGFSWGAGIGRALPINAVGSATLHYWEDNFINSYIIPRLKKILTEKQIFGHNWTQFDQKWAKFFWGLDRTNIVFDTMYGNYLIDEEDANNLEYLALKYTSMPPWKKTINLSDMEKLHTYLCKDVDATWRIREQELLLLTEKQKWLMQTIIIPLGHELMEMEYAGIKVNTKAMDDLREYLESRINEEKNPLQAMPEVQAFQMAENVTLNVDSPEHLGKVMEFYLKLPCIKRTASKQQYATGDDVLETYKDVPFVKHVQKIRKLSKLYGTYCKGMQEHVRKDGRIHTHFSIPGTVTGRLASSDPNLQNIPREDTAAKVLKDGKMVKRVFGCDEGYCLLQMDLSQNELRVLAYKSGDKALTQIFLDGRDAHTATAAIVEGIDEKLVNKAQRTAAKKINFGVPYGMHENTLIEQFIAAGNTHQAAKNFYEGHKRIFNGVWAWIAAEHNFIREHGYQETNFGRRRHYAWIDDRALRQGQNCPIQSEAGDFCEICIIKTGQAIRKFKLDAKILLTVHDSIVCQVRLEQMWDLADMMDHIVKSIQFDFMGPIRLKADFECGFNWGDMKKLDLDNRTLKEEK